MGEMLTEATILHIIWKNNEAEEEFHEANQEFNFHGRKDEPVVHFSNYLTSHFLLSITPVIIYEPAYHS